MDLDHSQSRNLSFLITQKSGIHNSECRFRTPENSRAKDSFFIVVLVPLSKETFHLFGKEQFAKMKSTAYFINASRGPVVDTDALYEALIHK